MSLLEQGYKYYHSGLTPLPIETKTKRPSVAWKEFQTRRPTLEELEGWLSDSRVLSVGTVCGEVSGGLLVLDFDEPGFHEKWLSIVGELARYLPTQRTGGGGYQVFLRCKNPGKNRKLAETYDAEGKVVVAIETRGEGGFVVLPPSLHPSGGRYEWLKDSSRSVPVVSEQERDILLNAAMSLNEVIKEEPPVEMEAAKKERKRRAYDGMNVIQAFNERHDIEALLTQYGYTRRGKHYCRPGVTDHHGVWIHENKSYHHSTNDPMHSPHMRDCFDLYTYYEHNGNAREAYKAAARELGIERPRNGAAKHDDPEEPYTEFYEPLEDITDLGHVRRLVRLCGKEIMYNANPFKSWYIWDGKHWQKDNTNIIYSRLNMVHRDLLQEAVETDDKERGTLLQKAAIKIQSAPAMKNVVFVATTDQSLAFSADDLDSNGWLFNCDNCTIDLESGYPVARPHNHADRMTKISPVFYDPSADCPNFKQFLFEIFAGDEALIDYVKRALGYCLTGNIGTEALFFAYGLGANGKSVFFRIVEYIFGDYSGRVVAETLLQSKHDSIPSDVALMHGKRFVVASELPSNKRLNEAKVKDLTGNDRIRARRMYEDFFDFAPSHKLWMYGNHKPEITGDDNGIWRRIKLIPFLVTIPKEKQVDPHILHNTFIAEASGILNWMLQGYVEYREKGFDEPDAVVAATKAYRSENDMFGDFMAEKCMCNPSDSTMLKLVADAYKSWAGENNERELSTRTIGTKLRDRGFTVINGNYNKVVVKGLTLL